MVTALTTASMGVSPHLLSVACPGADVRSARLEDAGRILADVLREYMSDMGVVDGLQAMGYSSEDIPSLLKGTQLQVCAHSVFLCNSSSEGPGRGGLPLALAVL